MDLPIRYASLSSAQKRAVRCEYAHRQSGRCCHCGEPLDGLPSLHVRVRRLDMRLFPRGFLSRPVHLHHDHRTGLTIGAVHARCNAVLWQHHGK